MRDHILSLLHSSQYGFIPGRFCTTQLLEVLYCIGSLLDTGRQTDIIFMDMSKAFDMVSHAGVISKLSQFIISGSLLNWFFSYLHGRHQGVTTLGATSSSKPVPSGVPQGSILDPILFPLYANDLSNVAKKTSVACLADDTKIFRCIDSIADATSLQSDVDYLDNWSSTGGINFNELKCKCVRVTRKTHPIIFPYNINGKELANSSDEKDLRVWITSDLTWTKHVLDRCSNANKLLGYVRRSSREYQAQGRAAHST